MGVSPAIDKGQEKGNRPLRGRYSHEAATAPQQENCGGANAPLPQGQVPASAFARHGDPEHEPETVKEPGDTPKRKVFPPSVMVQIKEQANQHGHAGQRCQQCRGQALSGEHRFNRHIDSRALDGPSGQPVAVLPALSCESCPSNLFATAAGGPPQPPLGRSARGGGSGIRVAWCLKSGHFSGPSIPLS
jgi:hypothetical protein